MNNQEILHQLRRYTKDEHFYLAYYIARQNPQMLQLFLHAYSRQELSDRKLIVPDLKWWKNIPEPDYLNHSMVILKHNRFTPLFSQTHGFYELQYVLDGQLDGEIRGHTLKLKKGELCLITPSVCHSIGVFDDSIILRFFIDKQYFQNVCQNLLQAHNEASDFLNRTLHPDYPGGFILFDSNQDAEIEHLILEMLLEYEKENDGQDLLLSAQLLYLFSRLIKSHSSTIQIFEDSVALSQIGKQVLSIIEREFATLTLQELAENLNFSPGYCSRLIKKEFGLSYTQLVLEKKFNHALQLLQNTDSSIAHVSELSGFESVEHFNRMFKRRYHLTPGQWRKKVGNN